MKRSILFLLIIVVTGCNKYFRAVNTAVPTASIIEKNIRDGKNFILHDNSFAYEFTGVKVSPEHDTLSGDIKRLDNRNEKFGNRKQVFYRYKRRIPEATVQNEVHLFTNQNLTGKDPQRHIAISSFNKMHDLQFDKSKTTRNHVGTAVGIIAGFALMAVILGSMLSLSAWGIAPA